MGAAKAVLVSDDALKGAGALDTAKVLAAAIKRNEFDLVLAATESTDGYTGTVPEQIAEVLGLPSVTFAKHIEIDGATVKVQRQTEAGYDEVECPLPAVVSVTAGVVEPRYPCFKGIMAAKSKPVDEVTVADLGIDAGIVGWAGAGQEIVDVDAAEERQAGEIVEDDGEGYLEDRGVPREPEGDLTMAISQRSGSSPRPSTARSRPITLELLAKARDARRRGRPPSSAATATPSPRTLGAHGATKVLATGDLGEQHARRRHRRGRSRRSRPDAPTCSCSAPPTTAATSPPACR